jgi:hypothetical protein
MNSFVTLVYILTTLMLGSQNGVLSKCKVDPKDYIFDFNTIAPSLKGPGGKNMSLFKIPMK